MCKISEVKQISSEGEHFLNGCSQYVDFITALPETSDLQVLLLTHKPFADYDKCFFSAVDTAFRKAFRQWTLTRSHEGG
jgi:hypothetical protein